MRDERKWNDGRRNKIGGAELTRQQPTGAALVKRVEQVNAAPYVEEPDQRDAQTAA